MYNNFDKPFKNFDEQIKIIKSRNVKINNILLAKEALKSISYYTLMNGYKDSFLSTEESENFTNGTTFEMIYSLHWLDISFCNIVFKYILLIEKSLKTKIAYFVGEYISIDHNVYTQDFRKYASTHGNRDGVMRGLREAISDCRNGSVTSYYKTEKNHIPPWILVNDIQFGLALQWYSILKDNAKDKIANQFIGAYTDLSQMEKKEFITKQLQILRSFRNKTAHSNRAFNINISENTPKKQLLLICGDVVLSPNEFDNFYGNGDIYSVILSIIILINDPLVLSNFFRELALFIEPYSDNKTQFIDKDIFQLFNLPNNFLDRIKYFIENKKYS